MRSRGAETEAVEAKFGRSGDKGGCSPRAEPRTQVSGRVAADQANSLCRDSAASRV